MRGSEHHQVQNPDENPAANHAPQRFRRNRWRLRPGPFCISEARNSDFSEQYQKEGQCSYASEQPEMILVKFEGAVENLAEAHWPQVGICHLPPRARLRSERILRGNRRRKRPSSHIWGL